MPFFQHPPKMGCHSAKVQPQKNDFRVSLRLTEGRRRLPAAEFLEMDAPSPSAGMGPARVA